MQAQGQQETAHSSLGPTGLSNRSQTKGEWLGFSREASITLHISSHPRRNGEQKKTRRTDYAFKESQNTQGTPLLTLYYPSLNVSRKEPGAFDSL